jgi:hypothetical protein
MHGFIQIQISTATRDLVCHAIMNLILMYRHMKRIKQTGLAKYIFPNIQS